MATSSSQRLAEGRTSEFLLVPSVVVPSYGPKMEIFTPILESMSNLRMCDQSEGRICPYLLLPRLLTEGTLRPGRGGGWAGSGPASVLSLHIEEEEEEEEEEVVVEEESSTNSEEATTSTRGATAASAARAQLAASEPSSQQPWLLLVRSWR